MQMVCFVVDGGRYVVKTRRGFQLVSYRAEMAASERNAVFNWLLDSGTVFNEVELQDAIAD